MSNHSRPTDPLFRQTECTDDHGHAHEREGHHHAVSVADTGGSRLLVTLALNLLIPVAQIIGGIYAQSMALISDATHNFSDFTAILIAYFAYRIGKKGASLSHSFGYRRAEVLAALINVIILVAASVFIIYEAANRFLHPQPVIGILVIWIAGIGVLGNGLSAWLLHRDAAHNLNMRGAFLHMIGDLLTSVAVVISGIILLYKPWYWLDPLFSLIIVLFILKNCWTILKQAVGILMDATPGTIDLAEVQRSIRKTPGVAGAHYLHAWHTGANGIAFSAHVVVKDQMLSQTEKLGRVIRQRLHHTFNIDHAVLQFETECCGNGGILCEMDCSGAPENNRLETPASPEKEAAGMKKWVSLILRVILGAIFIYASIDKVMHPKAFAEAVYNYQILPDALVNLAALILPVVELLAGACLVIGFWVPGSLAVVNALLVVFIAAIGFNYSRGLNIACGCFHAATGDAGQWEMLWTIVRDAVMLTAGIFVFNTRKNWLDEDRSPRETGSEG